MQKIIILTLLLFISCSSTEKGKKHHPITEDLIRFSNSQWPIHRRGYKGQEEVLAALVDTVYKDGKKDEVEALYCALREAKVRHYKSQTLGSGIVNSTSRGHYRVLFKVILGHDSTDQMRVITENNGADLGTLTNGLSYDTISDSAVKKWFLEKLFHEDSAVAAPPLFYIKKFGSEEQKRALLEDIPKIKNATLRGIALKTYCHTTNSIEELKPLFKKIGIFSGEEQYQLIRYYGNKIDSIEELETFIDVYDRCTVRNQGLIISYGIPFKSVEIDSLLGEYFQNKKVFPKDYWKIFDEIIDAHRGELKPMIVDLKEQGRFWSEREYNKLMDTLDTF